ncbi:MAG: hypothetical protein AVDCRST_MAG64-680, partial [uncultured Phycisphaerae bacterium]
APDRDPQAAEHQGPARRRHEGRGDRGVGLPAGRQRRADRPEEGDGRGPRAGGDPDDRDRKRAGHPARQVQRDRPPRDGDRPARHPGRLPGDRRPAGEPDLAAGQPAGQDRPAHPRPGPHQPADDDRQVPPRPDRGQDRPGHLRCDREAGEPAL